MYIVCKGSHKNLAADMSAIFGVRADAYSTAPPPPPPPPLSHVDPERSTIPTDRGDDGGSIANFMKRRRDNKRDYDDGLSGGAVEKKKKRKSEYE